MKKKNIFQLFLSGVICLLCTTSCSVEPDFYSQVVPETFYSSQDAVWQRFNRPFTHWRWYIAHDSPRWLLPSSSPLSKNPFLVHCPRQSALVVAGTGDG